LSDEMNELSCVLVEKDERISVHEAGILRQVYVCDWE
jgi:hypothetical protein